MFPGAFAATMDKISIVAVPVLLAITLHEAAHGLMAKRLGDGTAWALGRVSLNPFRHIDPIGTVVLPLLLMLTTNFMFGYAKPVPVNFANLRHGRWGVIAVALAGPGANLALIFASIGVIYGLYFNYSAIPEQVGQFVFQVAVASIQINLTLMVFNLMPLLPLDGGRVLNELLPRALSRAFERTEPFGMYIILGLLLLGAWPYLMQPPMTFAYHTLVAPLLPGPVNAILMR